MTKSLPLMRDPVRPFMNYECIYIYDNKLLKNFIPVPTFRGSTPFIKDLNYKMAETLYIS